MVNYFTASDIKQLNNYALFGTSIPASLLLFRNTLNLGTTTDLGQLFQFQINTLTNQAKTQSDTWLNSPAAFRALHSDFQQFTDEFVRRSEQLANAPGSTGSTGSTGSISLFEFATGRTYDLLKIINQQQETMLRLATGIYTVLPRLIEYMYSGIFLFAQRQNMLSSVRPITTRDILLKQLSITINPPPDRALAYRYTQALNIIDNYQRTYALSYAAASNVIGYYSRLKEIAAWSVWQAIALRETKNNRQLKSRVNTLLISLKEIQRMSVTANALFQAPR